MYPSFNMEGMITWNRYGKNLIELQKDNYSNFIHNYCNLKKYEYYLRDISFEMYLKYIKPFEERTETNESIAYMVLNLTSNQHYNDNSIDIAVKKLHNLVNTCLCCFYNIEMGDMLRKEREDSFRSPHLPGPATETFKYFERMSFVIDECGIIVKQQ